MVNEQQTVVLLFKVGNKIELDVNFNVNELLILETRTFKYFQ